MVNIRVETAREAQRKCAVWVRVNGQTRVFAVSTVEWLYAKVAERCGIKGPFTLRQGGYEIGGLESNMTVEVTRGLRGGMDDAERFDEPESWEDVMNYEPPKERVQDEERVRPSLIRMLSQNTGGKEIGVEPADPEDYQMMKLTVCIGSGKWHVQVAQGTTMEKLAKSMGLGGARWWRTHPAGAYSERRGLGTWWAKKEEVKVWIKGRKPENECHLKVMINDRKACARIQRKRTVFELMNLLREDGHVEELEIDDYAGRGIDEQSKATDWPDRGSVTIKTREWMQQRREEWEQRERERQQREDEKREIERCMHYGRMFALEESEWKGEAETLEDLVEVVAEIETKRWNATLTLQATDELTDQAWREVRSRIWERLRRKQWEGTCSRSKRQSWRWRCGDRGRSRRGRVHEDQVGGVGAGSKKAQPQHTGKQEKVVEAGGKHDPGGGAESGRDQMHYQSGGNVCGVPQGYQRDGVDRVAVCEGAGDKRREPAADEADSGAAEPVQGRRVAVGQNAGDMEKGLVATIRAQNHAGWSGKTGRGAGAANMDKRRERRIVADAADRRMGDGGRRQVGVEDAGRADSGRPHPGGNDGDANMGTDDGPGRDTRGAHEPDEGRHHEEPAGDRQAKGSRKGNAREILHEVGLVLGPERR
jgi:hypothetical protein